eukprot:gb/GECG01005756.1/.p1 GENE.gb/GECG01005756.1/~~gb/GECG01005756.1/.p1  ORF type:complete len:440 (+),score=43.12 gb/GECG01005756.1/:1-1320(+)
MRSKRRGIAHNALPQKGMQAKGHGSLHYLRTSRMCRLIVYKGRNKQYAVTLSDLVVRPSHSIIKQSFGCTERLTGGVVPPHLNGDGFGIGWYCDPDDSESTYDYIQQVPSVGRDSRAASNLEGGDRQGEHHGKTAPTQLLRSETPGVYTSITPAWNNPNLVRLSEKIRSPLVFAHVRAASLGSPVTELNCHPFAFGRYLWMHNGFVACFSKIRRKMISHMSDFAYESIQGTSDSEHCFGIFLTELEREIYPMQLHEQLSPEQLKNSLFSTIRLLETWSIEANILPDHPSLLNFCVSDGETVITTRHVLGDGIAASLYLSSGSKWEEDLGNPGAYRMIHGDRREHVVIVASERLTNSPEDWFPVPPNHAVIISPTMNVTIEPIKSSYSSIPEPGKAVALWEEISRSDQVADNSISAVPRVHVRHRRSSQPGSVTRSLSAL